jgi:uncharacterized repeat protein (TIGR02543 family)
LDPTFIDLIPTASPGSTFTGWSGDCNGTAPDACSPFGVSQRDLSVTATFTKTSTASGDPGGGGAVTLIDLVGALFSALCRTRRRLLLHDAGQLACAIESQAGERAANSAPQARLPAANSDWNTVGSRPRCAVCFLG